MIDEDKLKSKIEGLKSNLIHGACSSQVAMETRCKEEAYNEVLAILDSMQEEPNDDWKYSIAEKLGISREEYDKIDYNKDYGKEEPVSEQNLSNVERTVKNWKEPVSEELEQAASFYANTHTEWFDHEGNPHVAPAFKAGATWMRDKMMKDAVDGLVYAQLTTSGEIMIRSNYFKSATLAYLDEVKLIIIKEDKV